MIEYIDPFNNKTLLAAIPIKWNNRISIEIVRERQKHVESIDLKTATELRDMLDSAISELTPF